MPTAALEELSNQRRSKKIGDGAETKVTKLDVLQRQRNKGAKDQESGGRGVVPGTLLKFPKREKDYSSLCNNIETNQFRSV